MFSQSWIHTADDQRVCRLAGVRRGLLSIGIGLTAAWVLGSTGIAAEPPQDLARISQHLLPLEQVGIWQAPGVDVARLLAEDEANREIAGIPYRIGFPMATDLSPADSGTWEELVDGGRLWRLRIRTVGALWTVLGFDVFRLQVGGELRVYDPAGKTVMGPYTAADIRRHGQLWFPPIAGDELVVELYWPVELREVQPRLHLGTVSHGYKAFGLIGAQAGEIGPVSGDAEGPDPGASTLGVDDSGSCNIDVACPLGEAWQDAKRGVVILLSGGSAFCSGSLINTTADDCRPFVLTAAHCGAGPSTTFGFNFEKPQCGAGSPPPATNQTVTGSTVRANFSGSDFTLLEMDLAPPDEFDVYFNGWSRDPQPGIESWGIHHPRGDVKKISHNVDPLVDGQNYGPNHWRVTEWEEGTTEPGSSGSPLFDQNQRIVGQLHGGTASCTSITWDEYGKVDASWEGGGTPPTRLRDWLDPEANGALTMDGGDWSTCAIQLAGVVELTRDLFSCDDLLSITLRDDHLAGQPTHDVVVFSDSEPTPETVTLQATDTAIGRFAGTFPIQLGPAVTGDGALSVDHADRVTVEYLDGDDGMGGSDLVTRVTASVDCLPPSIGNVLATQVGGASAVIAWDTGEASDSAVEYGPSPGGGMSVRDGAPVTAHSVLLRDLQECSLHYFAVSSTDVVGNGSTDDNLGSWYTFETTRNLRPDYASVDTPLAIPDDNPAGVMSTIPVDADETVLDVDVRVNINHTFTGDLALRLSTPGGQTILLANRRGGGGDDFQDTTFDDDAPAPIADGTPPFNGSFRPETPLAAANGISSLGDWTLHVVDQAGADVGTVESWTLTLGFADQACGPHASYRTHALEADSCPAGGAGDADGFWDAGEQVRFSLSLKNDGTDPLTAVTARVTALTAGVSVLDEQADFGDIAPGGWSDSIEPHFAALLQDGLACNDELAFQLDIETNQGSWTSSFAQHVGEVIPGDGTALVENFDGGIPPDWTVVDGQSDGQTWFIDDGTDPLGCANTDPSTPIAGSWAAVDSDCAGSGVAMDESLISPPLDLGSALTVALDFDHYFNRYQTELADVDVRSTLTGGAWVNLARFDADTPNPLHETFDLTSLAAGASDVQVRFRYYNADFDWFWYLDNLVVSFTMPGACDMSVCAQSAAAPPPVPVLLADRLDPTGGQILVSWDDRCAPATAKIVYGPLDQVSSYTVGGAECAIANPYAWDPAPTGSLWFVVLGENAEGVESSWGLASSGERNGLAASGTCADAGKDVSGVCP